MNAMLHEKQFSTHQMGVQASHPPKFNISSFMGYLKGNTATVIFEKYGNLECKFGNKQVWLTGNSVHCGLNKVKASVV